MSVSLLFLKCVGKGVINVATGGLLGVALDVGAEIAEYVFRNWREKATDEEVREELQQLAEASPAEMQGYIEDVMEELTDEHGNAPPTQVREQVEAYLQHIPAQIRRTMRRPSDPAGKTVPQNMNIKEPEDLLNILPEKLPRFHPGDHPLPGVDLEIIELLGIGGFGEVWKARNPHLMSAEPVALKFCLDDEAAKSLKHEAEVLDWLIREGKHPGIVQLKHTYLSSNPPCLEYEYIDGGDLGALIQEWHRTGQGISALKAAKTIRLLAEILAYAHGQSRPIVHRDLKPANILVKRTATGLAIKVADFGIGGIAAAKANREGKTAGTTRRYSLQNVSGSYTPLYASPEQTKGSPPDPRDDVHALGVIWYQMMIGDMTAGTSGGRWKKTLKTKGMTQALIDLMESCFESRQEDRPKDAIDLLSKMDEALEQQRSSVPGKTPTPERLENDGDWIQLVPVQPTKQPKSTPPNPAGARAGTAAVATPVSASPRSQPGTEKPKSKTVPPPPPVAERQRRKPRSRSQAIGERLKLLRQHELLIDLEDGLVLMEKAAKPVGLFHMGVSAVTAAVLGMFLGMLMAGLLVLLLKAFASMWVGIPIYLFWGIAFGIASFRILSPRLGGDNSMTGSVGMLGLSFGCITVCTALLAGLWHLNVEAINNSGEGAAETLQTLNYRDGVIWMSLAIAVLGVLTIYGNAITTRQQRMMKQGRQKHTRSREQLLRECPADVRDWGGSTLLMDRRQVEKLTDSIEARIDQIDAAG